MSAGRPSGWVALRTRGGPPSSETYGLVRSSRLTAWKKRVTENLVQGNATTAILMLEMLHIFTTYYTLVVILGGIDEERRKRQICAWWAVSGRILMLIHISLIFAGMMLYWFAISATLWAKYPYFHIDGYPFMYVCIPLFGMRNERIGHLCSVAGCKE